MNGDPKPLAALMYGGKEGNGPGEGYLYRGRGYIQLTGHRNYETMGTVMDLDPARAHQSSIRFGCECADGLG